MLYYPPNLKYIQLDINTHDARRIHHVRTKLKSSEWRLSVIVSWLVFLHLYVHLHPFSFFIPLTCARSTQGNHHRHDVCSARRFPAIAGPYRTVSASNYAMGDFLGRDIGFAGRRAVCPATYTDISPQTRWRAEYPDDGDPESRWNRHGHLDCHAARD